VNANPSDVSPAARILHQEAEAALRNGDAERAAALAARAVAQAPAFTAARQLYATLLLHNLGDPEGAVREIGLLLDSEPQNVAYLGFRAAALVRIGEFDEAFVDYETALTIAPESAPLQLRYGHALKTAGRTADAVSAYRESLRLQPSGEAWWSLADLKTVGFSREDVSTMRALAQKPEVRPADRAALHFALGRALEERSDHAAAFVQYDLGNTLRSAGQKYDAGAMTAFVDRAQKLFTPAFFAGRRGDAAPDPIFIVGLPRSGSTLVEQILSSHSQIEGTAELSDLPAIARQAGAKDFRNYPQVLAGLDDPTLGALGGAYLARTRIYRREARPFFIDKMPNNFIHAGLIQLILPNARIIDVRRHPLACGWSVFKQHFAVGQTFAYSLSDIGRFYADYVRLMATIDAALPGRVHRVLYEALVADPEAETRKLLAHCGVPFEEQCLRFHENRRAVRTASSEQVRRPIFRDALDSWRPYEPWLEPLKRALGPVLDAYPAVPEFTRS
jgi:tetratricopeptide (TPR) repeat protein